MELGGSLTVLLVLAAWVAISAGLTIFNAELLASFQHPILLTCWHQAVSVVLIVCVFAARPSLFSTGDKEKAVPPLAVGSAVWLGLPVAACQSVSLVCGNTAYIYLSLAFCQMIKAFTPAAVYTAGYVLGTQKWSVPIVKCLFVITLGLVITSIGEMNFHLLGFAVQIIALISEGFRINLLEVRLKASGYNLNALSSVMIFAPMVCVLLFASALLFDRSAFDAQPIVEIGLWVFSANAVMAFLLNVVIYLAIQCASGLTFSLAGVLKDFLIVVGSCIFQGRHVTIVQVVGYVIALAGLQAYGVVSKSPSDFEGGLVAGLLHRAAAGGAQGVAQGGKQQEEATALRANSDSTASGDWSSLDEDEMSSRGEVRLDVRETL
jgi:hypothetical protein